MSEHLSLSALLAKLETGSIEWNNHDMSAAEMERRKLNNGMDEALVDLRAMHEREIMTFDQKHQHELLALVQKYDAERLRVINRHKVEIRDFHRSHAT